MSSWRTLQQRELAPAAAAALGMTTILLLHFERRRRRCIAEKQQEGKDSSDRDILRVGYSTKKLPEDVDHVIIGSGLSGLYLGALLSKIGRRVVVLEQHYVAGGCTHTFKDKGFEFDTGVHYVGSATQFTAFMDFAAGRSGAFKMRRQGMDDGSEVYNEFHVGDGYMHRFRPGPCTFIQDLVEKYPREEKAIRRFFRDAQVADSVMILLVLKQFMPSSIWSWLMQGPTPLRWLTRRYLQRSLAQALTDSGVKDALLRATISAEFGDYGMVPEEAPFFLHAGILHHYMSEGGFSPVGGSDSFANALVPTIFEAGGAVLVRAPVTRIILEGGRAVGVELKGKIVRAKRSVISSAGVEVTYRRLLSESDLVELGGPPKSLLAAEQSCSQSGGLSHHIYGFIGFDGTSSELKLPTYNVWSLPTSEEHSAGDISSIWKELYGTSADGPSFLASDEAAATAQIPAFISFPSAKEGEAFDSRCPGKSTACIISESHADFFQAAGPTGKRGVEYESVKERYKLALLNALYRHFPHLKDKVAYVDVGTPNSNEHYLGRASSYGLPQNVARFLDPTLRVVVPGVKGLFLTGQDILLGGVFPQAITAWITFARVVGVFFSTSLAPVLQVRILRRAALPF